MPTSRGAMPLICRNKAATAATAAAPVVATCKAIGGSCYDGSSKSQSLFNFSGLTINCLRDTLDKVFYIGNDCASTSAKDEAAVMSLRSFPKFQESMKMAVRAALILYVIIYGFQIVMNNEYANFNKIALFLMKFILVTYFSIGLGAVTIESGTKVQKSGMTDFALPLLVGLTSDFTEIVFKAGGSQGLCNFDKSKYEAGYEFYSIWDSIDCRIGYYMGMQMLYNVGSLFSGLTKTSNNSGNSGTSIDWTPADEQVIKSLSKLGSFTYFTVMFGFFMSGQIIIVIMGLVFAIVFISMLLYFLTAYLVCLITLYVLSYIAPIFIPFALFDRTKSYFDSWLKLVISCTLQPAVIGGFIALSLTVYDSAIYGNCEFQRHDYSVGQYGFSTFELKLPAAEEELCKESFGYKLTRYYLGYGWETKSLILFEIPKIHDYLNLQLSLLYIIVYMVVFYFFMKSVNEFASDLVGGPNLGSVTVSPNSLVDKVMGAASSAASMMSSKGGASSGASGGASGKSPAGASASKGRAGGNGVTSDKMSSGGSGSGGSGSGSGSGGGG